MPRHVHSFGASSTPHSQPGMQGGSSRKMFILALSAPLSLVLLDCPQSFSLYTLFHASKHPNTEYTREIGSVNTSFS